MKAIELLPQRDRLSFILESSNLPDNELANCKNVWSIAGVIEAIALLDEKDHQRFIDFFINKTTKINWTAVAAGQDKLVSPCPEYLIGVLYLIPDPQTRLQVAYRLITEQTIDEINFNHTENKKLTAQALERILVALKSNSFEEKRAFVERFKAVIPMHIEEEIEVDAVVTKQEATGTKPQDEAERDRLAQAERDRLAQAERDRLAQAERDRLAQVERDRLAQVERDRLAQVERDRLTAGEDERDLLAAAIDKLEALTDQPYPLEIRKADARQEVDNCIDNLLQQGNLLKNAGKITTVELTNVLENTYRHLIGEISQKDYVAIANTVQGKPSTGLKVLGGIMIALSLAVGVLGIVFFPPLLGVAAAITGTTIGTTSLLLGAGGIGLFNKSKRKDLSAAMSNIADKVDENEVLYGPVPVV